MASALQTARRRVDLPFAATAALLFGVGAAGGGAQVAVGGALEGAVGSTAAAAVSATLALLAGSGIGANVAPLPAVRRARPLVVAGIALIALAALEVLVPRVVRLLAHAPVAVQAIAGAAALLLPSLATGAIVPLLARASTRDVRGSRRVAQLFGIALAGAASGGAIMLCALLPWRTMDTCVRIAAVVAAVVGAAAVILSRLWPRVHDHGPPPPLRQRPGANPLAAAAAAHGFLSGAATLLVAHSARVATHGGAATLGATLVAVLAGVSAGAAQTRRMRLHYRDTALVRALAASGFTLAATLFVWAAVPGAISLAATFLGAPHEGAVLALALALATMTLPFTWIGASFLLVLPHLAEDAIARGAARVAGAGTAGAALGASIAAVALVPGLGGERSLSIVTLGFAALAIVLGWRGRARKSALVTAFVTVSLVAFVPRWDTAQLAFGVRQPAPPAWTREEVRAGLAATTPGGDFGANGRSFVVTAADRRTELLATLLAPRTERAVVIDDPVAAAALLGRPWASVAMAALPPSWSDHLASPLRSTRDAPGLTWLPAPGPAALQRSPVGAQAVLCSVPPACGAACADALLGDALGALGPSGITLWVVRGTPDALPSPAAAVAIERAARAHFAHVARAELEGRVVVVAGPRPLVPAAGRLEQLPDAAEARALLVALDPRM